MGVVTSTLDLQVFLDAVDSSFPVPNPQAGPEWESNVNEVLIEAWSGGISRDEVCARADKKTPDAALKAVAPPDSSPSPRVRRERRRVDAPA